MTFPTFKTLRRGSSWHEGLHVKILKRPWYLLENLRKFFGWVRRSISFSLRLGSRSIHLSDHSSDVYSKGSKQRTSEWFVNCPKSGKCLRARVYWHLCKVSLSKALFSSRKSSFDLLCLPAGLYLSSIAKDLKELVFICYHNLFSFCSFLGFCLRIPKVMLLLCSVTSSFCLTLRTAFDSTDHPLSHMFFASC